MRVSDAWSDVCIRNISSRGMLVAAKTPPELGSCVEIRRGSQIIIARAVWKDGNYCGLRSQEKLPVQQIISEPRLTKKPQVAMAAGDAAADRRNRDRDNAASIVERQERSRRFATVFQFLVFVTMAVGGSIWVATSIYGLLAAPVEAAERALDGKAS
ncbi:MAG: PilZ domain-containing protein [Sphingomonas bacterium]|nr:PilZ domain-containing protein [Sphingomonas bacterium]